MKRTKTFKLFPLNKGLDTESAPGAQDPKSFTIAKNVILKNRGRVSKAPGVTSIPYTGDKTGVQAAIHYFGTSGGAQFSEVLQVRKGRVEVIRDNSLVDLGLQVSDTDTVVFERFANKLVIHFENTVPQTYTSGATELEELEIPVSHESPPPTFSRKHDFRLWLGGRGNFPDRLTVSAINDISNYTLANGGFQMRVEEGDGDPVGLTGLSGTFRGDIYAFKWDSLHRISNVGGFYGSKEIAEGVGCVHHNTIVTLKNDVYFVSQTAIHSLVNSDTYGDVVESTLSYPIYESFQESVNWAASKYMIATYDAASNCYLLSFPANGSAIPNRVLGFNILTKEFFQWEDIEYPALGKYFDSGRKRTLIGSAEKGLGILDARYQTRFEEEFNFHLKTGPIFPVDEPHSSLTFTKAWLYVKPTRGDLEMSFNYYIDGVKIGETKSLNFNGEGQGALIQDSPGGGVIGEDLIIGHNERFKPIPIELGGDGMCIEFELIHEPDGEDDQLIEVFGIIGEYEYNEDSSLDRAI